MNCGCMLEYKTNFALDSCPLEKWKESNDAWMNGKFDELVESLNNEQDS